MKFLLLFSIVASCHGYDIFRDFLGRLFTAESLDAYNIVYNISNTKPDVRNKGGRGGSVSLSFPNYGPPELFITGSSIVDAAYCIHQLCFDNKTSFSWNDLDKKTFPALKTPINKKCYSPFPIQHALNAVTVSYSMQWFDWTRWERMIDWMALHGINAPLMPIGHEAVQRLMLRDFDMDDRDWLPGAAFLSWARMGNLQRWAGMGTNLLQSHARPPSDDWISAQLDLARQIVERMDSLDMSPVLPAFSGFLPDEFPTKNPDADYQHLSTWSNFNCTNSCIVWLDPSDPLFNKFQDSYLMHQNELLNYTASFYALDLFNEVTPKSNNISFLAKTALDVRNSLPTEATWVMQGWLFHNRPDFWQPEQIKAFLQGVPTGEILILDLYAENSPFFNVTESFYGQPFIWCMLGNFGGNTGWYGALPDIQESFSLAVNMTGTTIAGTGIVPEGLFQNEFVYDFTMKMGYEAIIPSLDQMHLPDYISMWITARYGDFKGAKGASNALNNVVRSSWWHQEHGQHPNRNLQKSADLNLDINPGVLGIEAIDNWKTWMKTMMPHFDSLKDNKNYRYDLVDFTRAALSAWVDFCVKDVLIECAGYGDLPGTCGPYEYHCADHIVELLVDLNKVLQCSEHFMLGVEERDALASAPNDKNVTILNVRNQRTMWGPSAQINDYAARHYHGLVEFYTRRWQDFLGDARKGGCDADSKGYKKFQKNILQTEQQFSNLTEWPLFNQTEVEDYYPVVNEIWQKYRHQQAFLPPFENDTN